MSSYLYPRQSPSNEEYLRTQINNLQNQLVDALKRLKEAQEQNARVFRFLADEGLRDQFVAYNVARRMES